MKRILIVLFIAALGFGGPLHAQPNVEFEAFLLPVVARNQPGAHGSVWSTEFHARNQSETPVYFFMGIGFACQIGVCFEPTIAPRTTIVPETLSGFGRHGNLGYVERSRAGDVVFSARIRDLSREAFDHGTELPVIRERELIRGRTTLLAVPTSDRYRVAIRGYTVRAGEQRLRLEIRPLVREELLASASLRMRLERSVQYGDFYDFPGYDQVLDLFAAFPAARSEPVVRIEVIPETDQPYWVMVSVTNNETQRVTLVTPQ